MQYNSSLNRKESIFSINTSNKITKGARALAVRDSNVSKWCLSASKGLGRKRKKVVENNYLLKFHTWSPSDSYLDSSPDHWPGTSQTDPLPFDILSTHAMDERDQES